MRPHDLSASGRGTVCALCRALAEPKQEEGSTHSNGGCIMTGKPINYVSRCAALEQSLGLLIGHLEADLKELGDCDHSVGICVCSIKRDLAAANALLYPDMHRCPVCDRNTPEDDGVCVNCQTMLKQGDM
jgi:hypothetical protein